MAVGDKARAAGLTTYDETQERRYGYENDNRNADYIAEDRARLDGLESANVRAGGSFIRSGLDVAVPTGAWLNVFTSGQWVAEQKIQGVNWDGRFEIVTPGMYRVSAGIKLDAAVNTLFGIRKNSVATGDGTNLILAGSAVGTAGFTAGAVSKPIPLVKGDKIGLSVFVSASTTLTNLAAEKAMTFIAVEFAEAIR